MCLDYTYNGIPVAKMSTSDIEDCIRDGIEINSYCGSVPITEAEQRVRDRLELELFIRARRLR